MINTKLLFHAQIYFCNLETLSVYIELDEPMEAHQNLRQSSSSRTTLEWNKFQARTVCIINLFTERQLLRKWIHNQIKMNFSSRTLGSLSHHTLRNKSVYRADIFRRGYLLAIQLIWDQTNVFIQKDVDKFCLNHY